MTINKKNYKKFNGFFCKKKSPRRPPPLRQRYDLNPSLSLCICKALLPKPRTRAVSEKKKHPIGSIGEIFSPGQKPFSGGALRKGRHEDLLLQLKRGTGIPSDGHKKVKPH
jgi:hypothetical protein